jgi:alcohol dehydrogenase
MTPLRPDGIRHRPRPAALHIAGALTPTAAMASKVALERDVPQRVQRLHEALRDAFEQRRRPTRERMRALTVGPGGRFRWRDVPAPSPPGPDGATVHPIAMATCDLDRLLALGATPFILPLHFGHECVAEVLAVGENVATVRPGDRVVVPFQISCGACRACRAGFTGNCENVPPISMYGFGVGGGHWGGAVSDQLAVPFADGMLVPLPDGIDPAAAASVADNVSDGYRHVAPYADDLLARDPDAEMLIVAGIARRPALSVSITLYAGLVARAVGIRAVHVVDTRAHVREHAERLGLVAHRPSELRRLPLFPLVMDASGSRSGLAAALHHTAEEGICSSAGGLHRTARIPSGLMFGRNVTCRIARSHARAVIPHVLELMRDGKLSPELVTTDLAPIDEAPQAIRRHVVGDATKTVLVA